MTSGFEGHHHSDSTKEKLRLANLGKKLSIETRMKQSNSHKGKLHPWQKGKHLPESTRLKIGKIHKGRKRPDKTRKLISKALTGRKLSDSHKSTLKTSLMRKAAALARKGVPRSQEIIDKIKNGQALYWSDPVACSAHKEAIRRKWKEDPDFVSRKIKEKYNKPNKVETTLQVALDEEFPNEWKYVGDGGFILAGKCPDFVNINGKKAIIEVYGDYWHRNDNPQDRIDLFLSFGYNTLILWEKEIKDIQPIIQKVRTAFYKGEEI